MGGKGSRKKKSGHNGYQELRRSIYTKKPEIILRSRILMSMTIINLNLVFFWNISDEGKTLSRSFFLSELKENATRSIAVNRCRIKFILLTNTPPFYEKRKDIYFLCGDI